MYTNSETPLIRLKTHIVWFLKETHAIELTRVKIVLEDIRGILVFMHIVVEHSQLMS